LASSKWNQVDIDHSLLEGNCIIGQRNVINDSFSPHETNTWKIPHIYGSIKSKITTHERDITYSKSIACNPSITGNNILKFKIFFISLKMNGAFQIYLPIERDDAKLKMGSTSWIAHSMPLKIVIDEIIWRII